MLDGVKFSEARMCIIRFPRDGSEIVFCGQNEGGRVVVAVYKAIGSMGRLRTSVENAF